MELDKKKCTTDEELRRLEELTPIKPLKKIPFMPFRTLGEFLNEFNIIMEGKSKLSIKQRTHVTNIIHEEVRKGRITLTIEENGD